jgi:hypothetical protein
MAMSLAKRRKGMAEKEVKRVLVKILKEGHAHEGKPCKPGDAISVTQDLADWLVKIGAGEIDK